MAQQTDRTQRDVPAPAKISMRLPCDAGRFTFWLEEFVQQEGEKNLSAGSRPSLALIVVEDRHKLEIARRLPGDEELPSPGLTVRDEFEGSFYWMLVTIIEVTFAEVDEGLDVTITSFLPGQLRGLAERLVQGAKKELGGELHNVTDELQVNTRTGDHQVGGRDEPHPSTDDPISDEEVEAALERIPDETYRKIARLWRKGLPDSKIAAELHLGKQTVKNRVTEMRKLLGEPIVPYHRD